MKPLKHPDNLHLQAAQGWLELGNHLEANEELEKITPQLRVHPDVLEVRWHIYSKAKKWDACVDIAEAIINLDPARSEAWIHRSYALHELKRTQEAFDLLLPAAEKFPDVWLISYNLACYTSQLGRFPQCEEWLRTAFTLGKEAAKTLAIDDPDLEPLWENRGGSKWKRSD